MDFNLLLLLFPRQGAQPLESRKINKFQEIKNITIEASTKDILNDSDDEVVEEDPSEKKPSGYITSSKR